MEKTFEEGMKELEGVVAELEKSEISLDEAIAKFEEGMKLSKQCNKYLEDAEKKINIIANGEEKAFNEQEE